MQSALDKRDKLGGAFRDARYTRHNSRSRACSGSNLTQLRSLKRRAYQCLLIVICTCLAPGLALAKGSNIPAVNLISPESVRGILAKYFVLPDNLLLNDNDRAVFMRRAQREIPELLTTEGYFSSKVVLRSVTPAGVLVLEVIPGRRTVVTEVSIEYLGDLSLAKNDARMKQLRADWSLRTGMPFRATDWDEAKAGLLAQVAGRDYAAARLVESSAKVDPAKASASLHVVVDSGPRFLFGELQVSGLERYKPSLINRFATFKPGQPYDRKLLLAFQNQLQSMPQFSSVLVNFDVISVKKQAGPLEVPVRVKVVEAQSRKISLGIGYSTNNGVRNQVGYQSYNFLNQAWTLNSSWIFEQNRQTLSALLGTQPNPLGYRLSWNASGEKTQIQVWKPELTR
jgi:translocation and assembly module TamA